MVFLFLVCLLGLTKEVHSLDVEGFLINGDARTVAVTGVSYNFTPLCASSHSLTCWFEKAGDKFYHLYYRGRILEKEGKSLCRVRIVENGIKLSFVSTPEDISRPYFLFASNHRSLLEPFLQAAEKGRDGKELLWKIEPAYAFTDLSLSSIDFDSLLFRFPRQDQFQKRLLSREQIQALYSLHQNKRLTLVAEDNQYAYGYPEDYPYRDGIYIQSDFDLTFHHLEGCKGGIDKTFKEAFDRQKEREGTLPLRLPRGCILLIAHNIDTERQSLKSLLLGNVEIRLDLDSNISSLYVPVRRVQQLLGFFEDARTKSYQLKDIIKKRGDPDTSPHFGVQFFDNKLFIFDTNGNIFTNPGVKLYYIHQISEDILKKWEISSKHVIKSLGGELQENLQKVEKITKEAIDSLQQESQRWDVSTQKNLEKFYGILNKALVIFEDVFSALSSSTRHNTQDICQSIDKFCQVLEIISQDAKRFQETLSKLLRPFQSR